MRTVSAKLSRYCSENRARGKANVFARTGWLFRNAPSSVEPQCPTFLFRPSGTGIANVFLSERQRVGCCSLREFHDCARSSGKWVGTRWLVGSAAGVWLRSPPFCLVPVRCTILPSLFIFAHQSFHLLTPDQFFERNNIPYGIRRLLAYMNCFHRAGIVVAKERTGQSSGFKLLANKQERRAG